MLCSQPRSVNHYRRRVCLVIVFMVLGTSAVAFSHSAVLWTYVENNHVYVEAFFMGGSTKVKNGRVVVVDANGKKLLEGKTDVEGKFDFVPPIIDDMTILLILDKAHGSEFKIKKQDFEASENIPSEPAGSTTHRPE